MVAPQLSVFVLLSRTKRHGPKLTTLTQPRNYVDLLSKDIEVRDPRRLESSRSTVFRSSYPRTSDTVDQSSGNFGSKPYPRSYFPSTRTYHKPTVRVVGTDSQGQSTETGRDSTNGGGRTQEQGKFPLVCYLSPVPTLRERPRFSTIIIVDPS